MKQTNKEKLFDYLKSQHLMCLATCGENVSACTVYYAVDDNFNLYFVSPHDTEHSKNIEADARVACSIADSRQNNADNKIGVQIKGRAEMLRGIEFIKAALKMWNKANPGVEDVINFSNIKNKVIKTRAYKITPSTIKFFNDELYGDDETEEFNF